MSGPYFGRDWRYIMLMIILSIPELLGTLIRKIWIPTIVAAIVYILIKLIGG